MPLNADSETKTKKNISKNTKSKNDSSLKKIFELLKSATFFGLVITLFCIYAANVFYTTRDQNDSEKNLNTNWLYELMEIADLKSTDLKFKFRGQEEVNSSVVVLTVDDQSIEELGRWPWSREKIAFFIDKAFSYGIKALGMDMVFSEPQISDAVETIDRIEKNNFPLPRALMENLAQEKKHFQPDQILASTIEKYRDKIILGSFSESSSPSIRPYQDHCRNFYFEYSGGTKIINRLNSSFIVNDDSEHSDELIILQFDQALKPIFDMLRTNIQEDMAKEKISYVGLSDVEVARAHQFQNRLNNRILNYCNRWLTDSDDFLKIPEIQDAYLEIFKKSKTLAGLDITSAINKFKTLVPSHPLPDGSFWTQNTDIIQKSSDYTGSFIVEQDRDGSIRKSPLFFRTGNKIGTSFIPGLALQTYLIATGYQLRINFGNDPRNAKQKIISHFDVFDQSKDPELFIGAIPVDKQARLRINYIGGTNSFPYVPAKELFTNSPKMLISQLKFDAEQKKWLPADIEVDKATFLKDKVLVFGSTAIGVYDLRVTPFEKNFPGLEIQTNILSNLMNRHFLKVSNSEPIWMPWAMAFLGLMMTLIVARSGALMGFGLTSAVLIGLLVLDFWMFKHGLVVSVVIPFFMTLNLFIILTVYKYFSEERKKHYLRETFSQYVSPSIVDEILKHPDNVQLGGKKIRMSVFFSDVRNFTSFSEKLDPQVLSEILNEYLTPMTQIVFANKGTLDKYMGDAVMAFFGAPVFYEDHAACACRCALQSISRLSEIQHEFSKRGLPRIDIGIGINSGEMSVGNMGSDIVRSYTVMGDAVNLGSRLESANKQYGTQILISEFTQKDIQNSFTTREIDWVLVKGKAQPVKIFQLICEGAPTGSWKELLPHFNRAFILFHQQKFEQALEELKKVLTINPDDQCSRVYVERCENYLTNPPSENWDGVYKMKTK